MPTPKMITRRVSDMTYDIEMPVDDLISQLQKDRTRLVKEGWSKLEIELDEEQWSDRRYAYLKGCRMETEEEARLRELAEDTRAKEIEARDRRDYERLRGLFEK